MVGCLQRRKKRGKEEKKEENIDQKSGKNCSPNSYPYPHSQASIACHLLSTYYIYYKYYKIFPWKKFSQEHVFATLWPIFENVSSGKLKRGRNIVKKKLNNI